MEYISLQDIENLHTSLLNNTNIIEEYMNRRGLTLETIKKNKIGWDGERITIPILDECNNIINVRRYKLNPGENEPKIISWGKGYGANALYFIENVVNKEIIICEGEHDCILLNQYGFNAVTGTCGAGSFKDEWINYFNGKDVIIIFDCDNAGRDSAKGLLEKLISLTASIKNVNLNLNDKEDITDWFVTYKKDAMQLRELINSTETSDSYKLVDLSEAMNPIYFDQNIKFYANIIGKITEPYNVVKNVKVSCSEANPDSKKCVLCPLLGFNSEIEKEFIYDEDKEILIQMINSSETQVKGLIRYAMGIPSGKDCRKVSIEKIDTQNIEDISIVPEVNADRSNDAEHVTRRGFYFGDNITTNKTYLCYGTFSVDPRTQSGIHLIKKVESSIDSISKFVIDNTVKNSIKLFEPEDHDSVESIQKKLAEKYHDLTHNVTRIYKRNKIMLLNDILYFSALGFNFVGAPINKGWCDIAIIGDTTTGKTETITKMQRHYGGGDMATSGENMTRAGILGGVSQSGQRWNLHWGRIPYNNRGLLWIDEADEMSPSKKNLISLLSGVRRSGIAEITMVQKQKTIAKTRLGFIANSSKPINNYTYGINAAIEIFGNMQDLARCDLIYIVSKDDVDLELINKVHDVHVKHIHTSDLCHKLLMWAWNRKHNDYIWQEGAEQLLLNESMALSRRYTESIPLLLGSEARGKVARVAAAIATMTHSSDDTGEKVIIRKSHVLFSIKVFKMIYDNHISGFYELSKLDSQECLEMETLNYLINNMQTINKFLTLSSITLADIQVIFACDRDEANRDLNILFMANALVKVHHYYNKTSAFIVYLKNKKKELMKGDEINF